MYKEDRSIVESIVLNYKINKQITLSSGKVSDFYYDIKSLLLDNISWNQVKDILISDIRKKFPGMSCVAGAGVGGTLFVMRIVSCSVNSIRPIIVRDKVKEYGLLKQIEGHCPNGSPRVVIVDDVCTTGKNFVSTEKVLRDEGIKTLGNYVFLKRKESNFNCESLVTI